MVKSKKAVRLQHPRCGGEDNLQRAEIKQRRRQPSQDPLKPLVRHREKRSFRLGSAADRPHWLSPCAAFSETGRRPLSALRCLAAPCPSVPCRSQVDRLTKAERATRAGRSKPQAPPLEVRAHDSRAGRRDAPRNAARNRRTGARHSPGSWPCRHRPMPSSASCSPAPSRSAGSSASALRSASFATAGMAREPLRFTKMEPGCRPIGRAFDRLLEEVIAAA